MNIKKGIVGTVAQANDLGVRLLTSIPMLVLVIISVYFGEYIFLILCCLVSSLVTIESIGLLSKNGQKLLKLITPIGVFAVSLSTNLTSPWLGAITGGASLSLIIFLFYFLNPSVKSKNAFLFIVIIIIAITFSTIAPWLRNSSIGLIFISWLCLTVWATDIGAYTIGRLAKGPKLAPLISPNKTISGSIGGILVAIIASLVWSFLVVELNLVEETPDILILTILGALISIIAQLGDLIQSAFKRYIGVKDTSKFIPGHGGIMDRADSLIFATLVSAATIWIIGSNPLEW